MNNARLQVGVGHGGNNVILKILHRNRDGTVANQTAWYALLAVFGTSLAFAIWTSLRDLGQSEATSSTSSPRSFYETIPDVPLETLPASRREKVLRQLNSTQCVCPCALTLARCRNTDRSCKKSLEMANGVLKEIQG